MNQNFFRNLERFAQKAIKVLKKNLNLRDLGFDHICYQTLSNKDYEEVKDKIKNDVSFIKEIPHSGRRIAVVKLNSPIKVDGILIDKLEISEPKPKRTVIKGHFDHFALFVKGDFKSYIEHLKKRKIKIFEEKQIGEDKLVKFKDSGVEIEIRNNRLAEVQKGKQKSGIQDKSVEGDEIRNIRKELELERERKLRAIADYQNLIKRLGEERKSMRLEVNANILGEVLDILDDLDRAIECLKVEEPEQVGIRLVRDKIRRLIDSNGLVEIKIGKGEMLDANKCEAVGVVAVSLKEEDNMVKQIVQKGYMIKESGQIVRPVKVIVGKK